MKANYKRDSPTPPLLEALCGATEDTVYPAFHEVRINFSQKYLKHTNIGSRRHDEGIQG